jgi:nucleotide-binding universal stress UspA family protein
VLNGTILFILVTCTLATIIGEKGAHNIALAEAADDILETAPPITDERILIPMNDITTIDELVNLSVTMTSAKTRKGIYAMHVADNSLPDETAEKHAGKILEKAEVAASSTDNELTGLLRYDSDVVNGIAGVIREQKITDLILGIHHKNGLSDSFLGSSSESILSRCNITTFIYKPVQPLGTIKRTILVIPEGAQHEIGFASWMQRVIVMIKNTGSRLVVYASKLTIATLKEVYIASIESAEYKIFQDWDHFTLLARDIKNDDNLIIVMSRKNNLSYHAKMARIPAYLDKYFQKNSFILIYPVQSGIAEDIGEDVPVQPLKKTMINFENILKKVYKRARQ